MSAYHSHRHVAIPLANEYTPGPEKTAPEKRKRHAILPSRIGRGGDAQFLSRAFKLQYVGESVKIQETAQFRLEIPAFAANPPGAVAKQGPPSAQLPLMDSPHAVPIPSVKAATRAARSASTPPSAPSTASSASSASSFYSAKSQNNPPNPAAMLDQYPLFVEIVMFYHHGSDLYSRSQMDVISSRVFRLQKMAVGGHTYIPVTFDDAHFSHLELTTHSSLVDFSIRPSRGPSIPSYNSSGLAKSASSASLGASPSTAASPSATSTTSTRLIDAFALPAFADDQESSSSPSTPGGLRGSGSTPHISMEENPAVEAGAHLPAPLFAAKLCRDTYRAALITSYKRLVKFLSDMQERYEQHRGPLNAPLADLNSSLDDSQTFISPLDLSSVSTGSLGETQGKAVSPRVEHTKVSFSSHRPSKFSAGLSVVPPPPKKTAPVTSLDIPRFDLEPVLQATSDKQGLDAILNADDLVEAAAQYNADQVMFKIFEDLHLMGSQITSAWKGFAAMILKDPQQAVELLKRDAEIAAAAYAQDVTILIPLQTAAPAPSSTASSPTVTRTRSISSPLPLKIRTPTSADITDAVDSDGAPTPPPRAAISAQKPRPQANSPEAKIPANGEPTRLGKSNDTMVRRAPSSISKTSLAARTRSPAMDVVEKVAKIPWLTPVGNLYTSAYISNTLNQIRAWIYASHYHPDAYQVPRILAPFESSLSLSSQPSIRLPKYMSIDHGPLWSCEVMFQEQAVKFTKPNSAKLSSVAVSASAPATPAPAKRGPSLAPESPLPQASRSARAPSTSHPVHVLTTEDVEVHVFGSDDSPDSPDSMNSDDASDMEEDSDSEIMRPPKSSMTTSDLSKTAARRLRRADKGIHLIVFTHGFMGTIDDLRPLKNALSVRQDPKRTKYLLTGSKTTSEEDAKSSNVDLFSLAASLAGEVSGYIREADWGKNLTRISFVGHSLGALVVRAALETPIMEPYLPMCCTFISLSSPHLGTGTAQSSFITGAMKVYRWLKKTPVLDQLCLSDAPNSNDLALMKLAHGLGFAPFDNVILVSAPQDSYVPLYSSRIERLSASETKSSAQTCLQAALLDGTYKQLSHFNSDHRFAIDSRKVIRVSALFELSNADLHHWLGRRAHLHLLDSAKFVEHFVARYGDYLD